MSDPESYGSKSLHITGNNTNFADKTHKMILMKNAVPHNECLTQFSHLLNYFQPQPDNVLAFFRDHTVALEKPRGTVLLKKGHPCLYYYFICKGAVRGYIKDGNKEVTIWMSVENEIATSISGLDFSSPALESMELMEDSVLLLIESDAMQQLYDKIPEFNITGRKVLQAYYKDADRRAYIARLSNAEVKYLYFMDNYPHLINRAPLKYIASFLGISQETLSRVRNKLSR